MDEMIYKAGKQWRKVLVYNFYKEKHLMAVIYDPDISGRNNGGGGWTVVRAKHLLPLEYYNEAKGYTSISYKNKIKKRLEIVEIKLKTTDGQIFDGYAGAIEHEIGLYEAEKAEAEALPDAEKPDEMKGEHDVL